MSSSTAVIDKRTLYRLGALFAVLAVVVLAKVLFFPHWGDAGPLPRLITAAGILLAVRWVLRPGEQARAPAAAAASAPDQPPPAFVASVPSGQVVMLDWRCSPDEALEALGPAVAPFGVRIADPGEPDDAGWLPFSWVTAGGAERLRVRHDAEDSLDDLMAAVAKRLPRAEIVLLGPTGQTDTPSYLVLSPEDAARLRAEAGARSAHWLVPLKPTGAALLVPAV